MVGENYKEVLSIVEKTATGVDRNPADITLIAVSKTKPVELLREVYNNGARDFGENKVQEIMAKFDELPGDIRWHMIGHLQTNKVKYIADKVFMIHSVDTEKLAATISKEALKVGRVIPVLIEVNVAKEDTKYGIIPEHCENFIRSISSLPGIAIKGLMTIAPFVDNGEENRVHFQALKQLSVDIMQKNIDNVSMEFLSMGMSGDYETAIEEGANFVRVGTKIFGERNYLAQSDK